MPLAFDVRRLNRFAAGEVGDGACDFEDAVVSSGGEGETVDRGNQEAAGWRIELACATQVTRAHFGIALNGRAAEAVALNLPRRFDSFANRG